MCYLHRKGIPDPQRNTGGAVAEIIDLVQKNKYMGNNTHFALAVYRSDL
jgi:hypothetical protein